MAEGVRLESGAHSKSAEKRQHLGHLLLQAILPALQALCRPSAALWGFKTRGIRGG